MENNATKTIYDIEAIVKMIEAKAGTKAKRVNLYEPEYTIGRVTVEHLTEIGFTFKEMSNSIGVVCPIYEMGNLEALFNDTILHVIDNNHKVIKE